MNSNHNLIVNTLAGTLLSITYIAAGDIVKTALLAAVGAATSLLVSLFLRFILKKVKQKFRA